ncbi:hypothetical protein [Candidatus Aquiluna sp. UB-MaderosW2red]|nr:hypothetical protein [Candidatus Aquiluna sp. UB-MaderosW2red]
MDKRAPISTLISIATVEPGVNEFFGIAKDVGLVVAKVAGTLSSKIW